MNYTKNSITKFFVNCNLDEDRYLGALENNILVYIPTLQEILTQKVTLNLGECSIVDLVTLVKSENVLNFVYVEDYYKATYEYYKNNNTSELVSELVKKAYEGKTVMSTDVMFSDNLTKVQKRALVSIYEVIEFEGNVSLKTMVEKYHFSRPTYEGLLNKMKQYGIAEVISQGVKGTKIVIVNKDEVIKIIKEIKGE